LGVKLSWKTLKMKRKRIKNVTFAFEGAHLAITDWSQGGAASFENEAILFKSKDEIILTDEQKKILSDVLEEEFKPLVMKAEDLNKTSSSSSEGVVEDDNKLSEGNKTEMSEDILKQLAELKAQNEAMASALKAIEVKKVEDKVSTYSLPEALSKSVSDLLFDVGSEKADVIYKALDALVEAKLALTKAAAESTATDLAKALGAEVGDLEKPAEESLGSKIQKHV
jgi:hypothetical protein